MQLILISGLSGSGKSIALNVLEDARYYCVDNLPAPLLFETVGLLRESGYDRIAVSIDARSGSALSELPAAVLTLKSQGVDVRLLFLDATNETLIKRFSETRRKHPLSDGKRTLEECIARERDLLQDVGVLGHHIDTSDAAPSSLRAWIKALVEIDRSGTTLLFQSFGFKEGIPLDSDLVFDVRCLPNPYYDPRLRPLCGLDREVCDFLDAIPDVGSMLRDIGDFVERWLPLFLRDNRAYLTVAIGCTGGQHRSVYMVERLAARFQGEVPVLIRHRQLPPQ
ncbi:MAG TPA: RNase adapter RapZ [Burkholderiales bacterium]